MQWVATVLMVKYGGKKINKMAMNKILKHIYVFSFCLVSVSLSSCFKDAVNESIGILNDETSIYTVRNLYKGADADLNNDNLGGAKYTSGIVVSNHENGNFPQGSIAIQNTWRGQIRGIVLEVSNPQDYHFGDSVLVEIDGARLTRKNGPLTLSNLGAKAVQVLIPGKTLEHRPISIKALKDNPGLYESTLISVTADVGDITPGATVKGSHTLTDGAGNELTLLTMDGASFADKKIAPNASFKGILLSNGELPVLYMQSEGDMINPSGQIYAGWPETFENPSVPKGSYHMVDIDDNVGLSTGEWKLYYAILGVTAGRDRIVSGENAVRMQQNSDFDEYVQMNFDVPDGASKVTFWYGSYYNDRSCTFKLEYSTDEGVTWEQMGEEISDAHPQSESSSPKQAVFLMDIQGPVRFRITKLGLGVSSPTVSNGRLGIDDFAIYKSY